MTTDEPTPCPHTGGRIRKFEGSIVCCDCHVVLGNWRHIDGAERDEYPAAEREG